MPYLTAPSIQYTTGTTDKWTLNIDTETGSYKILDTWIEPAVTYTYDPIRISYNEKIETTPTSSKYIYDNWHDNVVTGEWAIDIKYTDRAWTNDYSNIISTNVITNVVWDTDNNISWGIPVVEVSKKDAFVGKLKSNLVIAVKTRAQEIQQAPPAERIALETLREVISEAEFRKYLRYGFILVKGQSGDVFQVFRNRSHTRVWRNGKVIEEICVRINEAGVPPTDNVIAFRQIIQTSEAEFKKLGNVYKMAA